VVTRHRIDRTTIVFWPPIPSIHGLCYVSLKQNREGEGESGKSGEMGGWGRRGNVLNSKRKSKPQHIPHKQN
jgi:hypothetical protein